MKKTVRLGITVVLLAASLLFFLGKVVQFDFEESLEDNALSVMIADISGDDDFLEEDLSVKEAVDIAIETIDDGMADGDIKEIIDDSDDLEEGIKDFKAVLKTIRDSGWSYLELGTLMNFMLKYDGFIPVSGEGEITANVIRIFSYIMVGLAILWSVLGVLLALANKGVGFVLYMIHTFVSLFVSILLTIAFSSVDSNLVVTQPIAPICSAVIAIVLVIFWFSTKKKVID